MPFVYILTVWVQNMVLLINTIDVSKTKARLGACLGVLFTLGTSAN